MEDNIHRDTLLEKSDEQLVYILYFEKSSYNYSALQEVKKIIEERNLSKEFIQKTKREQKRKRRRDYVLKRKESAHFGLAEAFFDILLIFLP